jgi:hypothetical protein
MLRQGAGGRAFATYPVGGARLSALGDQLCLRPYISGTRQLVNVNAYMAMPSLVVESVRS